MSRFFAWLGLIFALLLPAEVGLAQTSGTSASGSEKRVALVVGNSAYAHTSKLANPKNDATDLAGTLKGLGFTVLEAYDLSKPALEGKLREYSRALAGAQVGLLFYAGHGLQVGGQNYLLPVDARLDDVADLDLATVRLETVQKIMERHAGTNLIFLDACRDNPLARNLARAMGTRSMEIGRGLAPVESGIGTLISFSTQPGNVALDGDGRNSPFASALIKHLTRPGEDLSSILIEVRNDVMAATKNRQVPWEHSALRSRFFFSAPAPRDRDQLNSELAFILKLATSEEPPDVLMLSYMRQFPDGAHAGLARLLVDGLRRAEEVRMASLPPAEAAKRELLSDQAQLQIKALSTKQVFQVALTEKHIGGFMEAQKALVAITAKLEAAGDSISADLMKELDEIAQKRGFKNFEDFELIRANIMLVLAGIDPDNGQYSDPIDLIKKDIEAIKADKSLSEADRKAQIEEMNDALKEMQPLRYASNIKVVQKYAKAIDDVLK